MIRQKFVAAAPGAVAAVGAAASKTPWPLIALPARSRNVVTLWVGPLLHCESCEVNSRCPPLGDQLDAVAHAICPKRDGSFVTLRWRERDSNHQFPHARDAFDAFS